jgi:hypothetical protein
VGQCMEVFEGEAVNRVGQNVRSMEVSCCVHFAAKKGPPRGFPAKGDCDPHAPAE